MSLLAIAVPILTLAAAAQQSVTLVARQQAATTSASHPKEVVEWLASRRTQGFEALVKDLTQGRAKDERVVLFGRAAFGTHEMAEAESKLASMAERFDVIAADVGLLEGMAVDAYLARGEGDLDAIVASLVPWNWSSTETKALLQALRAAPKRPRFHGIGFGSPVKLIEIATEFWDRVSYGAGTRAANMCGPLHVLLPDGRPRYLVVDPTERYLVQVGVSEMNTIVKEQIEDYTAKTSKAEYTYAAVCAERLYQTAELLRASVDPVEHDPRGKFLASNLHELVQGAEKSARVLALIHVRDLGRGSDVDSLAKQWEMLFGAPAFTVGSAFLEAKVRALAPSPVDSTGPVEHALAKEERSELESLLAAAPAETYVLDLQNAPKDGAVATWLGARVLLRSAREVLGGSSEAPWDYRLALDFDRLVVFPVLTLSTRAVGK